MSGSKHFDKIAWTVTALMLIVTILFMNGGALGLEIMAHTMGYEKRLFDNTRVHTIDIIMDDWEAFIDNATSEEYYTAAMVIDGESYKYVGIRGKGNTSLSNVASMNSNRYSFKVEFDHYDNSITYHGLDKLSLNNLIQDATMMKDYLTYTMMNELGAAAPLCSFVYITVNGEDWGLYLAVEGIEDSFLERNYGSSYGELYKPDSMSFGGGRGNGKDFDMDDFMNREESADGAEQGAMMPEDFGGEMPAIGNFEPSQMQGDIPQMPGMIRDNSENSNRPSSGGSRGDFAVSIDEETLRAAFVKLGLDESLLGGIDFENITMQSIRSMLSSLDEETIQKLMQEVMNNGSFEMPDMGEIGGGGGMGSSDVKLQYVDDDTSSYSNIWNNAKTDITAADQTRLIESLKKLSAGEQIEFVVDVEQVIRYFVVHNYVCNGDSYTGSMIHNYYLYEEDGQMAMVPWDYNLAFGTFQGSNAKSTVNTPIDAPVDRGSSEDRPMWNWILSDESYTNLYHQYFAEFLNTVDIDGIIGNAFDLIKSYVEKDPTAFYTYEEFEIGVEALRLFCSLRSESITMQLENGETTSDMSYVDASGLTLSDMGSMGGKGGNGGGTPDRESGKGNFAGRGSSDSITSAKFDAEEGASAPMNTQGAPVSTAEGISQNGEAFVVAEGIDPSQMQGSFGGQKPDRFSGQPSDGIETIPSDNTNGIVSEENSQRPSRDQMQMTYGDLRTDDAASGRVGLIWVCVSLVILGVGLLAAKLYRRG